MTEAFAIKGPDGNIKLQTIRGSEKGAWQSLTQRKKQTLAGLKANGYCVEPVTVSEKGEAEALLTEVLLSTLDNKSLRNRIDAYLRRQG